MSLPQDLLEQAQHLAARETTRPKQASLRRAVSAAYYALFHLLVDEAASTLVADRNLRNLVSRAFQHGEMKKAALPFATGTLPPHLMKALGSSVSKDLQEVAAAFVELQEARHEADYDLAARFYRTKVNDLVRRAEHAFQAWERIKSDSASHVFLAALLLAQRWNR
jgi:uncharacterized protein (UPF0332 family)